MLGEDDPAPDFDLPRPTGEGTPTYRLSAAASDGPVTLAFVGLADAPGTLALLRELGELGWSSMPGPVAALGVCVDEMDAVAGLADSLDLPYPLLADPDGFFAQRYGVLEEQGGQLYMRRGLFIVDQSCRLRFVWRATDPEESPPVEDVAATLRSL